MLNALRSWTSALALSEASASMMPIESGRTLDESIQSAYGIVTPLDKMFMYKTAEK